ncbi:MAG: hypothetical protein KF796_01680 [Ramlibacter sp.]|nr:hypothetical protein [Ramlibacter sp.]
MKRFHFLAGSAGLVVAVAGGVWLALLLWLPDSEELARQLEAQVLDRSGIEVSIGQASWRLWPTPALEVRTVRTAQTPTVRVDRMVLAPRLGPLWRGKLELAKVELDGATVPHGAMGAFRGKAGPGSVATPSRLVFRDLTWISHSGVAVAYDGEVDFDPQWRPRHASLRRPGAQVPASLDLAREGEADRWQLHMVAGGGTADGTLTLKVAPDGQAEVSGELAPRGIEVAAAMAAFNRRSPISGLASGRTVVRARGATPGEVVRSLHTTSELTVAQAVVLRFDLNKAIESGGKAHQGETRLDSLAGRMDTQNTGEGVRFTYSDLKAKAGPYTATGEAEVYQRQVRASGTLDRVEGFVGVPFTVRGPVSKPEVTIPPGFFAGAAIGTALLPGIGTVLGARVGGALGRALGGAPVPPASAPRGPQSLRP